MAQEVIALLQPRPGDTMVDCNVGTGGHSLALLEACGGEGFLVGLDLDDSMLTLALERIRSRGFSSRSFALVHADYADLSRVLGDLGLDRVNRIVMDLGASSLHFDDPMRGFSCQSDGPLDMRYDLRNPLRAMDIINTWEEPDLARLFREDGDELWAWKIARRITSRRLQRPFERTADLADAVASAIPRKAWPPKIHPATRVFLALRVAVNGEKESLRRGLDAALEALALGGRLGVLTFQSHEDRAVKQRFREVSRDEIDESDPWGRVLKPAEFRDLTRKPIRPTEEETRENPRSRSAKLRGVERIRARE